ncbi:MAG: asparagine synthase (glutamine-hydrolyzing) [Chitinophagales bacterium]|nr:asparagine synthase (glutamine-hydrolyzing) [Chitinophagales bacterium]
MCGIAGYFAPGNKFPTEWLKVMSECVAHRGPDAEGFYKDDIAGLAHRRLSIIDLSCEGNQPMFSHDRRYVIIFNGEIYNYKEIARELNISFRSDSDTEVMLEAFNRWGTGAVTRFNGMFTIALYDTREKVLTLFRDRLGVKPLFYVEINNQWFFASEIKALLSVEWIRTNCTINQQAIYWYLQLGYIPQPLTIWNEIKKFPAGNFLTLKKDRAAFTNYWKIEDQLTDDTIDNENTAKQKLDELLHSSVKYRMISDVPFGTFLSGGVDSSLVTAIAQRNSPVPIKTFTIGFKESEYNEADHAKKISQYLKTDHYEFYVSQADAIERVEPMMDIYDEPFADSSAIPALLLSREARKHIKMVLTGDGGDELFMGYGAYRWASRLNNPVVKMFRFPLGAMFSLGNNRAQRVSRLFQYISEEKIQAHIFSQEQYFFSEQETHDLLINSENLQESFFDLQPNGHRKLSAKELQTLFDLKYYLKDDLLVKVDRAGMQYGLECRTPFLDYRLVSFALNVSENLKLKKGDLKILTRRLLADYLPPELFDRPKHGFALPLQKWLQTDLKYLIDKYLSDDVINKHKLVDVAIVNRIKKKFTNGKTYLYNRLWNLLILHRWMERHSA